jgi:four helix bundle protein
MDTLDLAERLPRSPEADAVRRQFCRAGTAIGANVEEANGAASRRDARRSFVVARKEARETRYWLRLIQRRWGDGRLADPAIAEVSELINIVSVIIQKLT